MTPAREKGLIADILRVDHAGEYGAIRIYEAQLGVARWRSPSLIGFLQHTLDDERRHRTKFADLMLERGIQPCRTLFVWGLGGWALGAMTGLMGQSATLICTEAVEKVVHRHLVEQRVWLDRRDPAVALAIEEIEAEELEHLEFAKAGTTSTRSGEMLKAIVSFATETLIFLSTYGASARMSARLRDRHL